MTVRAILPIVVASLALARLGSAQVPASPQDAFQTPPEVARFLLDHAVVVQLPAKGKVKPSIKKGAPTFRMPGGPSSVVLLRLPNYQAPYVMTVTSFRRGLGRTTEIFVPSGVYFDAELQPRGDVGENQFAGRVESLVAELAFGEANQNVRYLLLYTRGESVGQRMDMRGDLGLFNAGVFRLERSLEAKLQVETKPATKPK